MARKSTRPQWMRDLDQDQIDFYLGLDPQQAVCRGKRRHKFGLDDLIPGRAFPRGIDIQPAAGGVVQITDHCQRRCGRWIRYTTGPDGLIDWDTASYGGGGDRYHARGLGLSASDDREFMRYLQADQIRDAIQLILKRARRSTAEAS